MNKTILYLATSIMMLLPMLTLADFEIHHNPANVRVTIPSNAKPTNYRIYIFNYESGQRVFQTLKENNQTLSFPVPKGDVRFGYELNNVVADCSCDDKLFCKSNSVQNVSFQLTIGKGGYHNCTITRTGFLKMKE